MTKVRFGNNPFMTADFRNIFNDISRNVNHPRASHSKLQSAVNIIENKKFTEIQVALPGIDKENVDIKLDRDILNISVRPMEQENIENKDSVAIDQENANTDVKVATTIKYRRKEFDFSNFKRSFHLPESIDTKKIDAQFKNGVLILSLPKKEEIIIEPQKIAIK